MKKRNITWVLVAGLVCITGHAADVKKAIKLFDGNDLKNWTQQKPGAWEAKDGMLGPSAKPGGYIWSKANYDNFELALDFKMSKRCNSGVFSAPTRKTRCRVVSRFRSSIHMERPKWASMTAEHCTTRLRQA